MGTELVIRPARREDARAFVQVVRGGFEPSLLDCMIYGCSGVEQFIDSQLALPPLLSDKVYFVAQVGEQVAGCVELRLFPDTLFLNYIAVVEPFRSRGVAAALLAAAVEQARRTTHAEMQLDVFEHNTVARAWYAKLGFEHCHRTAWWDLPVPDAGSPAEVYVSGYPQAEVCQQTFGFSQFDVTTITGRYTVGRLGEKWFRLTQPEALADAALPSALVQLGVTRRLLALVQSGPAETPSEARLLTHTHRMRVPLAHLVDALAQESGRR